MGDLSAANKRRESEDRPLVVVDPGHGGSDPGADAFLAESEVNLDLALLFSLRGGQPYDVLLTRTADKYISLADRVALSNANNAAAFLSFHCNASINPESRGFEVWTSPGNTRADSLATRIFSELTKACPGMPGRADWFDGDPDKETGFYVLRHTVCPAVLIEFGFITNEAEALLLDDVMNQIKIVEAVDTAVRGWLKEEI